MTGRALRLPILLIALVSMGARGSGFSISIGGFGPGMGGSIPEESGVKMTADAAVTWVGDTVVVQVDVDVVGTAEGLDELDADGFELVDMIEEVPARFTVSERGRVIRYVKLVRTYELRPTRPGSFTLGPLRLKVDGRVYESNALRIEVRSDPGAPTASADAGAAGDSGDAMVQGDTTGEGAGAARLPPGEDPAALSHPLRDLTADEVRGTTFARIVVNKRAVYVGEQITASYYYFVLDGLSVVGQDVLATPKFEGAWSEDLTPSHAAVTRHIVLRRPYNVLLPVRRALFATAPGSIAIPRMSLELTFRRFGRRPSTERVDTEPVEVIVKPLPTDGRPAGFEPNNVGTFSLRATVSDKEIALGEAVTFNLELDGIGNYKVARPPSVAAALGDGWEVYEPTVAEVDGSSAYVVRGLRRFEYVLLPKRPGELVIPALEMPYFDPRTERFEIARTEPVVINVVGPAGGVSAAAADAEKTDEPGTLRPLRASTELTMAPVPLPRRAAFWGFMLVAPALFFGLVAMERLAAWRRRTAPARVVRKAESRALQQLRQARSGGASANAAKALETVHRTLLAYLTDKTGERVAGWTREDLRQRLPSFGFTAEAVETVANELERCEAARYAPAAVTPAQVTEAVGQAEKAIRSLAAGSLR